MVGDNADTDIRGALDAGWDAIWLNPNGTPRPDAPAIRARNIPSLQALLQQ